MSRRAISRESKRRAARKTAEDKSEHQSEDDAPEFPVQTADDSLASLRKAIHSSGAIEENDTLTERSQPAIEPVFGDTATLSKLHPDLMTALRDSGITQLYRHQAEAVEAALGGNNVVLQSPPASGKTLAVQLPMLDTMLRDPEAPPSMS